MLGHRSGLDLCINSIKSDHLENLIESNNITIKILKTFVTIIMQESIYNEEFSKSIFRDSSLSYEKKKELGYKWLPKIMKHHHLSRNR